MNTQGKSIAPVASESSEHKIRLSSNSSQKTIENHKSNISVKPPHTDPTPKSTLSSFNKEPDEAVSASQSSDTATNQPSSNNQTKPTVLSPLTTDKNSSSPPEKEIRKIYNDAPNEELSTSKPSLQESKEDKKDMKSPKTENITFSVRTESEKLLEKQISQFVNTKGEALLKQKTEEEVKQMVTQFFNTKEEALLKQKAEEETKQIVSQFLSTKGELLLKQILEKEIKHTLPRFAKQLVQEKLDKLLKIEDDKDDS